MSDFLKLESILRTTPQATITDIILEPNLIKFKVNGYQFLTYGDRVIHEKNPMYQHQMTEFFAAIENDPEEIDRAEQMDKMADYQTDLFLKHANRFLKILMTVAIKKWRESNQDDQVLREVIEAHVEVYPTDLGIEVLKKIEEKYK